jgi:hypothetical protein
MCRAFPGSDYYGSSATSPRQQRTVRLPQARRLGGHRRDASHVHHRPVGRVGAQLYPGGIIARYRNTARDLTRPIKNRTDKTALSTNEDRAPQQPTAASFRAAAKSRGFYHWFVDYAFLPRYRTRPAGGGPLLDRQGLLPPSTTPLVSDCPSASPDRYGGRRWVLSPHPVIWRLVAHLRSWRTRGPADARGRVRSVLAPARRGSPTGIERMPGRWVLMVDRLGRVAATDDWLFKGGWR